MHTPGGAKDRHEGVRLRALNAGTVNAGASVDREPVYRADRGSSRNGRRAILYDPHRGYTRRKAAVEEESYAGSRGIGMNHRDLRALARELAVYHDDICAARMRESHITDPQERLTVLILRDEFRREM